MLHKRQPWKILLAKQRSLKIGLWEGILPRSRPFPRVSPLGPALLWFVLPEGRGEPPPIYPRPVFMGPGPRPCISLAPGPSPRFLTRFVSFPAALKIPWVARGSPGLSLWGTFPGRVVYCHCLHFLPACPFNWAWSDSLPPPQGLPWSRSL